jgi:hypothetical protein
MRGQKKPKIPEEKFVRVVLVIATAFARLWPESSGLQTRELQQFSDGGGESKV